MPVGGVYGSSKSGLQARWGSDLDCQIQRPKIPKTALPSDVRRKLGLKERTRVLLEEALDKNNSKHDMCNGYGDDVISYQRNKNAKRNGLLTKDMIQIKKQPFLRKGSRCGRSLKKTKSCAVLHSQLFE